MTITAGNATVTRDSGSGTINVIDTGMIPGSSRLMITQLLLQMIMVLQ
jgi:hypothetical protein